MTNVFKQELKNLPHEILEQPRFFQLIGNDKGDTPKGWNEPKNQKLYTELEGLVGFDTSGHGKAADYLFLDFDHIFNDKGEFVNEFAQTWFENTFNNFKTYCELSVSKHGAHMLALPTVGKFPKVTSGRNGRIYFDDDKKSYVEIFYQQKSRYSLLTGDVFRCEPNTPIAQGEAVDEWFKVMLDFIAIQNQKAAESTQGRKAKATNTPKQNSDAELIFSSVNSHDYDSFRAVKMLDAINPSGLIEDSDWLAVISSCKNIGIDYAIVDNFNRRDPERYNETENLTRWNSDLDPSFGIETLHGIAKRFGYEEKAAYREWCELHPEIKSRVVHRPEPMSDDEEEKFYWTRDRIKKCPVNIRIPDNYLFTSKGVTLIVPPKKDSDNPKFICAALTPIVPTRKFREPIKGTIEYEFAILDGKKWYKVEVDGAASADARDLAKTLAKYGAKIKKSEILREFLMDVFGLNPELQEVKSYNQTGWVDDDCEEFAYPSANNNAIIRRAGYDYERIFKPRGSRDAWKKKFVEVTEQGGAQAHAIIGFACSAPLVKPLEDLPNLQLHVWGKKSIGKTPMLKFAVSIFGNTDVGALTHTFAATPKSRLETACAFNDLPLICEELESIGAKDSEKLSQDIYNYFLGIGGQALKKDGTKRDPKLFIGARLTNGEHSLIHSCGNGGEFKRVLELYCASLLDEDFASDLYAFCKRNCGLFGEDWIKYTIKNRDLISKHYHQALDTVKARQKGTGYENDLTQLRTLVISLVDYQHFKICIGFQNAINTDELANDIDAITRTMPTAAEIDDTARAVEFLKSFVAGNDKFFVHELKDGDGEEDISQLAMTCYGKIFRDGEVAILPHELKRILEKEGGFKSADKLIAEFYDKSYLRHMNGKRTYPTWFRSKTTKMIRFRTGIITHADDANRAEVLRS